MTKNYLEYERDFCTVTDTFFESALQQNFKKMFHRLDFWKNEFASKQDFEPVLGKAELFEEKGGV